MSRFCFCNCPAGFSAEPERHAPDCPGRSGAGKARAPMPAVLADSQQVDSGVDFGIDGRSVRVSQEAYSIFLAREAAGREKIAALQQRLTAADERVDVLESALRELLSGTGTSPGANKKYGKARAVLEGSRKNEENRICSPSNPHNYHLGECTKCGAISPTE